VLGSSRVGSDGGLYPQRGEIFHLPVEWTLWELLDLLRDRFDDVLRLRRYWAANNNIAHNENAKERQGKRQGTHAGMRHPHIRHLSPSCWYTSASADPH
jgi:hypothetical protein